MCKKQRGLHNRIDKCIIPLIKFMNDCGVITTASCCGHGKYDITIVTKHRFLIGHSWEVLSKTLISRNVKIYKKDKEGYYYIPEVLNERRNKNKICRKEK